MARNLGDPITDMIIPGRGKVFIFKCPEMLLHLDDRIFAYNKLWRILAIESIGPPRPGREIGLVVKEMKDDTLEEKEEEKESCDTCAFFEQGGAGYRTELCSKFKAIFSSQSSCQYWNSQKFSGDVLICSCCGMKISQ